MKLLKQFPLLLFSVLLSFSQVIAQDDIDKLLNQSADDAEKLVSAYAAPLMKSVSSGLNQGWYNTAKPHKVAGIDITVTANLMNIPKKEMFYNVADLDLQVVDLDPSSPHYKSPSQKLAPTIFGSEDEPVFVVNDPTNGDYGDTFNGPGGIDLKKNIKMNSMPVPIAHLGIGLPKGTDLKIRFVPTVDLGDEGQLKMIGFGLMHDVKQWIPGVRALPFDLSAFVAYTKFELSTEFDDEGTRNAKGVFEMNATTIQALISKKISVLTVYGGLGYNIAKSKLALQGEYDINDDGDFNDAREKNPFDLKFGSSGPRMTAGFRLKLAVLTLHADYTLQKYNCLTVGVGLSIR
ncbi:DUF6588 family protein [Chryseosolibacter indicus]|uniref:Outer membrane protein beta-barrel domain-containing protein n=1 Tax=Chryseosolibacter indicus TaxID=2782351 RepID=A0ABS5VMU4_9BACT|nr:DUF6588 family protein [Chryseosolibacter indicus]MBT1702768.1 hypothetical protein [Chryseosolibacter indicus]